MTGVARRVHAGAAGRPASWRPGGWWRLALSLLLCMFIVVDGRAMDTPPFAGPAALRISPLSGDHDAWPATGLLADPHARLDLAEALSRRAEFDPPGAHTANLGRRTGPVWLHLPVEVAPGASGRWVLDVEYAPLDDIRVWMLDERDAPVGDWRLGDHVPWSERPMATRSHAVALDLPPGSRRTLVIRIATTGSLLAPLRLMTHERFEQRESREQALQGLIVGAGLILLLYSLVQWLVLRDAIFGLYALTLLGTTGFFAALSGFGPQHLWTSSDWLNLNGPPFMILVGVCGAFLFADRALEVRSVSPRMSVATRAAGTLAGVTALAFALGLVDYGRAQAVGMALGPLPLLLLLPTAFRRLRSGDRAAALLLLGWGVYSVGVLVIVGVLAGRIAAGFWSLHAFQFASLVEMASWMLVLAARVHDIRRQAFAVQADRDRLRSQAVTDGLTGLLNRRGLHEGAPALLAAASAERPLALYLVDLDGFKQVNDRLGHAAGDELLVAVAQRLRAALRHGDLASRLGGDEFVLIAVNLRSAADADLIGGKLMRAFDEPFVVGGTRCPIGLTVGYAIAPQDDRALADLLRRADAAMYAGKQAGRHQLRHASSSDGPLASIVEAGALPATGDLSDAGPAALVEAPASR